MVKETLPGQATDLRKSVDHLAADVQTLDASFKRSDVELNIELASLKEQVARQTAVAAANADRNSEMTVRLEILEAKHADFENATKYHGAQIAYHCCKDEASRLRNAVEQFKSTIKTHETVHKQHAAEIHALFDMCAERIMNNSPSPQGEAARELEDWRFQHVFGRLDFAEQDFNNRLLSVGEKVKVLGRRVSYMDDVFMDRIRSVSDRTTLVEFSLPQTDDLVKKVDTLRTLYGELAADLAAAAKETPTKEASTKEAPSSGTPELATRVTALEVAAATTHTCLDVMANDFRNITNVIEEDWHNLEQTAHRIHAHLLFTANFLRTYGHGVPAAASEKATDSVPIRTLKREGVRILDADYPRVGAPANDKGGRTISHGPSGSKFRRVDDQFGPPVHTHTAHCPSSALHSATLVINDFPQKSRWALTNLSNTVKVMETYNVDITTKGKYYPPPAQPGNGDAPKIYLLIEGDTRSAVDMTMQKLNLIKDDAVATGPARKRKAVGRSPAQLTTDAAAGDPIAALLAAAEAAIVASDARTAAQASAAAKARAADKDNDST